MFTGFRLFFVLDLKQIEITFDLPKSIFASMISNGYLSEDWKPSQIAVSSYITMVENRLHLYFTPKAEQIGQFSTTCVRAGQNFLP